MYSYFSLNLLKHQFAHSGKFGRIGRKAVFARFY